jgi:hypothetical protein
VEDEFDIQALRRQLREAAGVDRRKPPRKTGPESLGPGLFEWAGLDAPPLDPGEDLTEGPVPDWPPVVVPLSPANRARPFGRRLEPAVEPAAPLEVPDSFDLFGAPSAANPRKSLPDRFWEADPLEPPVAPAPRRSRLRRLQPLEAPVQETVAEFSDVSCPEEIAAAERAAEVLTQVIERQGAVAPAVVRPAQALLLSLANTLLLERDQLEARISDQQVPLVLTALRRRKGERDHLPLLTANDRG